MTGYFRTFLIVALRALPESFGRRICKAAPPSALGGGAEVATASGLIATP
jgi:hypothetical protein